MRVVAGKFRSRKLETIEGLETRPTADRIKEAVFSRIGPYFQGGKMLDLYSGSGSIAIEALSRGMDFALMNDLNPKAVRVIRQNLAQLKLEGQTKVLQLDAFQVVEQCATEGFCFNLIYLDPPYAQEQNQALIEKLCALGLLAEDGLIIVESRWEDQFDEVIGSVKLEKTAKYGITKISYYRRETEL